MNLKARATHIKENKLLRDRPGRVILFKQKAKYYFGKLNDKINSMNFVSVMVIVFSVIFIVMMLAHAFTFKLVKPRADIVSQMLEEWNGKNTTLSYLVCGISIVFCISLSYDVHAKKPQGPLLRMRRRL